MGEFRGLASSNPSNESALLVKS